MKDDNLFRYRVLLYYCVWNVILWPVLHVFKFLPKLNPYQNGSTFLLVVNILLHYWDCLIFRCDKLSRYKFLRLLIRDIDTIVALEFRAQTADVAYTTQVYNLTNSYSLNSSDIRRQNDKISRFSSAPKCNLYFLFPPKNSRIEINSNS